MREEIKTIFDNFKHKFLVASLRPSEFINNMICHYTSAKGLLGILSSGILRATNYSYLNDSSEIIYGYEIVKEIIEYGIKKESRFRKEFLELLLVLFESKIMLADMYVTCFSKNGDQLSQWRAYGHSAGCFSIGFDADNLQLDRAGKLRLGNVKYKIDEQQSIVQQKINYALQYIDKLKPYIRDVDNEDILEPFGEYLTDILMNEICFFKNQSFEEENEVRITFWIEDTKDNINKINFVTSNNNIIPYIELIKGEINNDFPPKLPIREIIIGPSTNQSQILNTLILMLYRFGYGVQVKINKSMIPLRNPKV